MDNEQKSIMGVVIYLFSLFFNVLADVFISFSSKEAGSLWEFAFLSGFF